MKVGMSRLIRGWYEHWRRLIDGWYEQADRRMIRAFWFKVEMRRQTGGCMSRQTEGWYEQADRRMV